VISRTRPVTLFLAVLLLTASPGAASEQALEGQPIVAITFDRQDIFDTSDPKTDAWFYRWANALHVVSKEDFLRSMLLFKEGDPYSESAAAESARILRSLGIINPVNITAREVEGGVEVMVETHDRWSLQLGGQAGVTGNRSSFGFDVEENNFLGWGKAIGIGYESDDERDAWSYWYSDPNVLNTRWRLSLDHSNLSDGSRDEVTIDRPFYSLATRWSWGVSGSREQLVDHLYSESESVVSGSRDTEAIRLWGGARLPGNSRITRRLTAGWEYRRDRYNDWSWEDDEAPYPAPEDLLIDGPSLSYQQIADRFVVVEGFRAWTVQEDVALGPNFYASTVFSTPATGGDQRRLLFELGAHAARQNGQWLVLGDAWASGRHEETGFQNLVAGLQLAAAQLGRKGLQLRLLAETSRELDLNRQFTLGADLGLRGWDPDFFDGTGRALLNAQWRTLVMEDVLGLFSFGVVVFGDAGMTWDPRVGPDTDGIRLDAGVGLLFDLSHLSRTNLLRVDLAFPDDGSGPTLTISTSTIFGRRSSLTN
jgi:hypothetical protein